MNAYIAPQTFREWHPIGIDKSINKHKPFVFNIGTLPMILWIGNNHHYNPLINVCKHLGNSLKDSKIKNNSLITPFHNQIYNQSDNFGSIIKSNGLCWWSYKSYSKSPYITQIIKTKDLPHNFQIDIDIDLLTFILNFISFFNNDINDINDNDNSNNHKNHKNYYHNKNKKLIVIDNDNFKILFKYPYSIIIKTKKFKGSFIISILPLRFNKLRIFVTTYNPFNNLLSFMFMNYIKYVFEKFITTDNLYIKNFFLFKKGMTNKNKYLELIYESYKDYMFLTEYTTNQFLINKNYY